MSVRLGWFGAGWILAGLLEWSHAPVLLDMAVVLVVLLVAALATDREARRSRAR